MYWLASPKAAARERANKKVFARVYGLNWYQIGCPHQVRWCIRMNSGYLFHVMVLEAFSRTPHLSALPASHSCLQLLLPRQASRLPCRSIVRAFSHGLLAHTFPFLELLVLISAEGMAVMHRQSYFPHQLHLHVFFSDIVARRILPVSTGRRIGPRRWYQVQSSVVH